MLELKSKIEGWSQKWEESEKKRAIYAIVFMSLVFCQNNYLCADNVVVKTNFLSNLYGSLKVAKSQRSSK